MMARTVMLVAEAGADPRARVRAALRAVFDPEFSDLEHLELWITTWAVGRTNDAVAAAERDFYEQCADRFRDAISDASPTLSPDVVSRRVTDLIAVQNGLWINWNRWGDREALERGLDLCEAIAFGESR